MGTLENIWESITGKDKAEKAAKAQLESIADAQTTQEVAQRRAIDEQRRQYDVTRKDMEPWRTAGLESLGKLKEGIEGIPEIEAPEFKDYEQSPFYDYLVQEGEKAILRNASARGMLASGGTAKALQKHGQAMASTDYDAWLKRYYDKAQFKIGQYYNKLGTYQGLAGTGQTATTNLASMGQNTASNIASSYMGGGANMAKLQTMGGTAKGSGYINAANAQTGTINSIMDAAVTLGSAAIPSMIPV